jgi:hypothetical protein
MTVSKSKKILKNWNLFYNSPQDLLRIVSASEAKIRSGDTTRPYDLITRVEGI